MPRRCRPRQAERPRPGAGGLAVSGRLRGSHHGQPGRIRHAHAGRFDGFLLERLHALADVVLLWNDVLNFLVAHHAHAEVVNLVITTDSVDRILFDVLLVLGRFVALDFLKAAVQAGALIPDFHLWEYLRAVLLARARQFALVRLHAG